MAGHGVIAGHGRPGLALVLCVCHLSLFFDSVPFVSVLFVSVLFVFVIFVGCLILFLSLVCLCVPCKKPTHVIKKTPS